MIRIHYAKRNATRIEVFFFGVSFSLLATFSSSLLADAQNPSKISASILAVAKIVFATNQSSIGGEIWLWHDGQMRRLFRDPFHTLALPVISPDGEKVAFVAGGVDLDKSLDGAVGKIEVIDFSGKMLSAVLLNSQHDGYGRKVNAGGMQGIDKVIWLGDTKLAVSGMYNSAVSVGYVIPLTGSERIARLPGDPIFDDQPQFADAGPLEISPGGLHIASVQGSGMTNMFPTCADASEDMEIDGLSVPMPRELGNYAVTSPFTWASDTKLSTIVTSHIGLAVVTVSGVKVERHRRMNKNARGDPSGDYEANLSAKTTFTLMPFGRKDGFVDLIPRYQAGGLEIEQLGTGGKPAKIWRINGGSLARLPQEPSTLAAFDAGRRDAASLAGRLASHIPNAMRKVMSSAYVWCGAAVCGALATEKAANGVVEGGYVKVPPSCVAPDRDASIGLKRGGAF